MTALQDGMRRGLLLPLPLLAACGTLTVYVPPPANVGDITDAGDLDITAGPTGVTAAYGVIDHLNLRASGSWFWGTDTIHKDPQVSNYGFGNTGPDGWDGRLGVGGTYGWKTGKKRAGAFVLGGSVDLGGGHIHDFTAWEQSSGVERSARLSAFSLQAVGQVTVAGQWRAGAIGGGMRLTGERLIDDGTSEGFDTSNLIIGRYDPFVYGRLGWAPFFAMLQLGASIQMEERVWLNEATNLYAVSTPVWGAFAVEMQFDRLGRGGELFHDPNVD